MDAQTGLPGSDDPACATIAPHIDRAWYRAQGPSFAGDPVRHYHETGWREGRNPNTWFDTAWYLRANADVRAAGIDPLRHFLRHGRHEGRHPSRPGGTLRLAVERAKAYAPPEDSPTLTQAALAGALAEACLGRRGLVVAVLGTEGASDAIEDERLLFEGDRLVCLHLSPGHTVTLNGRTLGRTTPSDLQAALASLPDGFCRLFVVHGLLGHSSATLAALAAALRAAWNVFWLHDYASLCPGHYLLRNDALPSGAPPPGSTACRICVHGTHRPDHLAGVRGLFEAAEFDVLSPSAEALELWQRRGGLPHRSARVVAPCVVEAAETAPPRSGPVRVAFIGPRMTRLGWPAFEALLCRMRGDAAYRFHHLAPHTELCAMDGLHNVPLACGRLSRFALVRALREHAIDLAVMPTAWPEPFSGAACAARAAGAQIVTLAGRDALLDFFATGAAASQVSSARAAGRREGRLRFTGLTVAASPAGEDTDPQLHVIAAGQTVAPQCEGNIWQFDLPNGTRTVRLLSRHTWPGALAEGEARRLGIAVARLELDGAELPLGDDWLLTGWHAPEEDAQWTSGDATLQAVGARRLAVTVAPGPAYRQTVPD